MRLTTIILMWCSVLTLCTFFICSCSSNCDNEMGDTRSKYGSPEEVNNYSSGGYYSTSWWYWTKGIEFTFTWGKNVSGCEVSTFTFEPIGGVVTACMKEVVEETKVLENTICYPCRRVCD